MEFILGKPISNFKKYRYLLYELVKKDIKLKYRNSYLGIIWTLLEPLLTMIVLVMVFSSRLSQGIADFPVYILSGRLVYSYFSNTTKTCMKSIRNNGGMIKKVYVPKYMYPLSGAISGYVTFMLSLIVLGAVCMYRGINPGLGVFRAVLPLLILFVMTLGVGMILATFAVFFRDLEYLWGVFLMLLMYASGIFYSIESMMTSSNAWLFKLNPLYAVICNFRNALFGAPLNMEYLAYSAGFSLVSLLFGTFIFYKAQDRFILHI